MKEVILRTYDRRKNKMIFGPTDDNPNSSWVLACAQANDLPLMLYIGTEDRNGDKIFDKDIVKFHYFYGSVGSNLGFVEAEHELIGIVEWGAFGWGLSTIKGEHWQGYTGYAKGEGESSFYELCGMSESSIHEESFEIIGNVFQSPEFNQY